MPKAIDERLFVHINNDAFLLGSFELEGNSFDRAIRYMESFITGNKQYLPNDVKKLLRASQGLAKIESQLSSYKALLGMLSTSSIASNICKQIQNLSPGEYLLMPGGWANNDGGHAMIYKFEKDPDGNLLFVVNNSGAGLSYHEKKSGLDKDYYHPEKIYIIPKNKIGDTQALTYFIEQLVIPQNPMSHLGQDIDEATLYEHIFPQIIYLNGKPTLHQDDDKPVQWLTAGQNSGTCTQRSIHQMLKSQFHSVDDYRRFIYRFKRHSLDEYFATLEKNNQLKQTHRHPVIEKAIRHQLRLLNVNQVDNPEESLFDDEFKQAEREKLCGYLTKLRQNQSKNITKQKVVSPSEPQSTFTHASPDIKPFTPQKVAAPLQQAPKLKYDGGAALLAEMDRLIKACKSLKKQDQNQAIIAALAHFFNQLPLPQTSVSEPLLPFYQNIAGNPAFIQFCAKLEHLQDFYCGAICQELGNSPSYNQLYVPQFHLDNAVLETVTNHVYTNIHPNQSPPDIQLLGQFAPFENDAVFFPQHDPVRDKRFVNIQRLYTKTAALSKVDGDSNLTFYNAIINQYPHLAKELNFAYRKQYGYNTTRFHKEIRETKSGALFYFLQNYQNKRKIPPSKYQPLIDNINNQWAKERAIAKREKDTHGEMHVSKDTPTLKTALHPDEHGYMEFKTPINRKGAIKADKTLSYAVYPSLYPEKNYTRVTNADGSHSILDLEDLPTKININEALQADNEVQLKKTAGEPRDLLHLRSAPELQIQLTLEYFHRNIQKLTRKDMQQYCEANVFQPGLLLALLQSDKKDLFFQQLDEWTNKGMQTFQNKGQFTQSNLFFLRLNHLVTLYAYKQDPKQFQTRLNNHIQTLERLIETTKDTHLKASFERYLFLAYVQKLEYRFNQEDFQKALQSYFYMQLQQNPEEDLTVNQLYNLAQMKQAFLATITRGMSSIPEATYKNILIQTGQVTSKDDIEVRKNKPPIIEIHVKGQHINRNA